MFAPHYWQHACPASGPGDGDNSVGECPEPIGTHQHIEYTEIPSFARLFGFKEESILGKQCPAAGCRYVVTDETVPLNRNRQAVRRVGGENLHKDRLRNEYMRCCHCKRLGRGHETFAQMGYYNHPGFRPCFHTLEWLKGWVKDCNCVWVNDDGERLRIWKDPSVAVPGGPLDLHKKHLRRKEARNRVDM